jgi:DNA repair protein RecN (Recombination protein N)
MLTSLKIKNYALIDQLEIQFSNGFSAITGETGAGKSILLGALGLILGNRADLHVLKDNQQKCVVEGSFNVPKLLVESFFIENDLDLEPIATLRREVLASGKSRAFVNDTPVNLQQLKELGSLLVDIHSQHETLQLGSAGFQMDVVDSFIHRSELLAAYAKEYLNYKEVTANLANLNERREDIRREEELLRFHFDELDQAKLDVQEFEEIEERLRFLNHAEEIKNSLSQAAMLLDESNEPILSGINQIVRSMEKIKGVFSPAEQHVARFNSVSIELNDLFAEIQKQLYETEFDPGEWQVLTQRLDQINKLVFKHRVDHVEGLIAFRDQTKIQLQGMDQLDDEILQAEKTLSLLKLAVKAKANELHDERSQQAQFIAKKINEILPQLGMKDAIFTIKVDRLSDFNSKGNDKVTFWFSANKGVVPGEISRMASGGELSRLMLAIKSLVTQEQMLPTVIFDEIDSGVSGDIAGKVGVIMKQMGQHHQVIAISHLPQIAASAGHQFKVFKDSDEKQTFTRIKQLSPDERVEEVAKMLSNENITAISRQAAQELLQG